MHLFISFKSNHVHFMVRHYPIDWIYIWMIQSLKHILHVVKYSFEQNTLYAASTNQQIIRGGEASGEKEREINYIKKWNFIQSFHFFLEFFHSLRSGIFCNFRDESQFLSFCIEIQVQQVIFSQEWFLFVSVNKWTFNEQVYWMSYFFFHIVFTNLLISW